jgi:hypothetical protein
MMNCLWTELWIYFKYGVKVVIKNAGSLSLNIFYCLINVQLDWKQVTLYINLVYPLYTIILYT